MPTPRKSLAQHELDGTKPHYEVNKPSQLVAGKPRLPKGVTPEAKRLFKRLCKQLLERRTLTEADEHLLTLAVSIWDRRERAQAKLLEEGEVRLYRRLDNNGIAHQFEKPNLWLKVAAESEKQLVGILDRLGLSPIAGSKVKQTRPAQDDSKYIVPGSIADLCPELLEGKTPEPVIVLPPPPAEEDEE